MSDERKRLEQTVSHHEEVKRRLRRKRKQEAPKSPAHALPDFPERPSGGWVECPGCHELYAALLDSGRCLDCTPPPEPPPPRELPRETILRSGDVPERFVRDAFMRPRTWPTFSDPAHGSLEAWAGDPPLLTLWGKTDSGKTMLGVELLSRLPRPVAWVVAARVPKLLMSPGSEVAWERLTTAGGLIVDELGRAHNRDAWEYVALVIGERWNWLRPTIVTTNMRPDRIDAEHPPLGRRLWEGGVVHLSEPWRKRTFPR